MALSPAIFIDKDGTLLQDIPYNFEVSNMAFAPGARRGLAHLAKLKLPLIVITNQPGIAMGKFGHDDLARVRDHLSRMFEEQGAAMAGFYFCPHHPAGLQPYYAHSCSCRKPSPGLLFVAADRHSIDLERSWFIGDILDDIEAGHRAGCRTVLIDNGNETEWRMNKWRYPDYCLPDLSAASRVLADEFSLHEELS